MIDASIALLKCVIDYGLCIWAFSWFAKRKSENRALFLGSIFLSSLFLFGINMLEIPWLNTIVSAFTLLVLFLVVFYTRWQQALPLALILVTLCVICEFTPPLIATVYKGNIIKNLIMDCQSYTKYRPNETTGGIFVSWRRKEELPTGA